MLCGGSLRLLGRNGFNRTQLFGGSFRPLVVGGLPNMVLDGETGVPDERGVTHLAALNEAISARQPQRLAGLRSSPRSSISPPYCTARLWNTSWTRSKNLPDQQRRSQARIWRCGCA